MHGRVERGRARMKETDTHVMKIPGEDCWLHTAYNYVSRESLNPLPAEEFSLAPSPSPGQFEPISPFKSLRTLGCF